MAKDFEWRTEEDNAWAEGVADAPEAPRRAASERRWPLVLGVFFVLGLLGFVVVRQLREQVDQTESDTSEEITTSFDLMWTAAEEGDVELFHLVLSGRDPEWTEAEKELLEKKGLFDRPAMGLHLNGHPPQIADTTLSPDLREAVVTATGVYTMDVGNGVTQTVQLQLTSIFRQGSARWLLSPPEEEFWGEMGMTRGTRLTLMYPQRDREIALRLARDLDEKVGEVCTILADLNCPANLFLDVRLETDPSSLLVAADQAIVLEDGRRLVLPAPTLVGVPVDEAGYQALFRGYASRVATAVISHQVDWECCRRAPLFRALLARQLEQLALQPWPLSAGDYERLLPRLPRLWQMASTPLDMVEDGQVAAALIEFLLAEVTDRSVAELERQVASLSATTNWLDVVIPGGNIDPALEAAWLSFVYERSRTTPGNDPPLPLPEEDMVAVCYDVQGSGLDSGLGTLYRFNLATNEWQEEVALGPGFTIMRPLPGDEGLLLQSLPFAEPEESSSLFWWRASELVELYRPLASGQQTFFVGWADPTGRWLLLVILGENEALPQLALVDRQQCRPETCDLIPLPGWPTWSPDGQQMIAVENWTGEPETDGPGPASATELLWLPEPGAEAVEIGQGYAPFWLDNATMGYIRPAAGPVGENNQEVVTLVAGETGSLRIMITLADLTPLLPPEEVDDDLFIDRVFINPAQPDLVYLIVTDPARGPVSDSLGVLETGRSYLFTVEHPAGDVGSGARMLLQTLDVGFRSAHFPWFSDQAGFSPDGRWLALAVNNLFVDGQMALYLYDLEGGRWWVQPQPFGDSGSPQIWPYDWSADGQWLLRAEGSMLALLAPAHDYARLIPVEP
ncbi:MAG: hypothetical protein L0322_23170, partial [Chloroflexi bacterium]|nr:hypothetical protein [Chloroflexota bacterium]